MKRTELKASMLRRSRDLSACSRQFLETIGALRERKQEDIEVIWNAAFHVNMIDHDITALLFFESVTDDMWARRTAARSLATVIYEAMDDLQELFGKKFIQACRAAGIDDRIIEDLRTTKKRLSEFQKRFVKKLQSIRMNAGAHRDRDATEFFASVVDADPGEIVNIACEFMDVLLVMGRFSSRVITYANESYRARGVLA